jgi:hypothetical protein
MVIFLKKHRHGKKHFVSFRSISRHQAKHLPLRGNRKYQTGFTKIIHPIVEKHKNKTMKKVCISFSNYTDVNFRKKAEFISTSLTGNASFTKLVPTLPEVKTAATKYSDALALAATKDRVAVAQKNKTRLELDAILKQLGLSVMTQANGDEKVLVSSGFTLTKTREARYITNPGNVTLSNGITSGTMVSAVKAIAGSKSYVHQIAGTPPADDTMWTSNTSSTCSYVFNNLVPGKQYWVRVAVIGARGQMAYSSVGSWYAQ